MLLSALVPLWQKKIQFLPNLPTKTWLLPLVLLSALVPLCRKKIQFLPNLSTKTWLPPLVLLSAFVPLWRKKIQFLPNLSTKTWLPPLVLLSALVPLWRKKIQFIPKWQKNPVHTSMAKKEQVLLIALAFFCFSCGPNLPDDVAQAYENLPDQIDFNYHVRPILSDRCYSCHGPDANARKANLRLDMKEHAFALIEKSQGRPFVKKNLSKSLALQRMLSNDPEFQMPPPDAKAGIVCQRKSYHSQMD